jgi:hypothetical protein
VETNPVSKSDRMTPAEYEVLKRAVQFIQGDAAQRDLRELKEAPGPNVPAEFLALAEAVAKLPDNARKSYGRK